MRRWCAYLLALVLVALSLAPASAAEPTQVFAIQPILPIEINPGLPLPILTPVPVAFSAIANRYTGVDPATVFDLNGDLVGDLKVSATSVTGQNGAKVQLVNPPALNLDQVNIVPVIGYGSSAPLQLSRVYIAQLSGGGYAKFMVLQASPKVTLWFMYGMPTTSVLKADGQNSHAVLTWDALPDATLGYNIYRYEVGDSSYTVTQLSDFTVQATTFTDETADNRYYLYVVQAVKAGGSPGSLTTVAPVFVQSKQHTLDVTVNNATAKLDGANLTLAATPVIRNGLLMVPASMLTSTGAKVTFQAATEQVTIVRRLSGVTYTVVMTLNTPDYTWNGTSYKTDVPPYSQGAEVMVPLRVVAPVLGLGVSFNSTTRTAMIQWYE